MSEADTSRNMPPRRPTEWAVRLQILAVTTLVAAGSAGCVDSGLPNRNTPVAEAAHQEGAYTLYEESAEARSASRGVYAVAGHRFIAAGRFERIPHRLLRPIGMANGRQVMVLTWDAEPFDRFYLARSDGTYSPLLRIP